MDRSREKAPPPQPRHYTRRRERWLPQVQKERTLSSWPQREAQAWDLECDVSLIQSADPTATAKTSCHSPSQKPSPLSQPVSETGC